MILHMNDSHEKEIDMFLQFIQRELNKVSTINDKTFVLFEDFVKDEKANFFISIKNNILNDNFSDFALSMREYGIILPFQKILYDLSKKYFKNENKSKE